MAEDATASQKGVRQKAPGGRPTKYKPEYCEKLIAHMSEGFGFESFGATIGGVAKSTMQEWLKQHEEFLKAKRIAEIYALYHWEKVLRDNLVVEKGSTFNSSLYIFAMKNKFGWSDRTDLRISADLEDNQKDFSLLRSVPRKELIALVKKKAS